MISLPTFGAVDAPAADTEKIEARIARVVGGLRPRVRFVGKPDPLMTLSDRMDHYHVPSVSVAVVDDYRVAWSRGFGVREQDTDMPVTESSVFAAQSVSKPVAALLTMMLVQESAIDLDSALDKWLTTWPLPQNEHTATGQPTIRQVLTHTAGFTRRGVDAYTDPVQMPSLLQSLSGSGPTRGKEITIHYRPGTQWRYSGGGYGVLQQLLVDVTGTSFQDLAARRMFGPLEMDSSSFAAPLPEPLMNRAVAGHRANGRVIPGKRKWLPLKAAGGLWTTSADLARLLIEVQLAWEGRSQRLISKATAREWLRPQVKGEANQWGLGVIVETYGSAKRFLHTGSGSGFRALWIGYLDRGQGAVILTNGEGAAELRYELLRSIASEYDWPTTDVTEYPLAEDLDSSLLERFEGTYRWEGGTRTRVRFRDGKLWARFNNGAELELHPLSPTRFVTTSDEIHEFQVEESGEVLGMTWRSGELVFRTTR